MRKRGKSKKSKTSEIQEEIRQPSPHSKFTNIEPYLSVFGLNVPTVIGMIATTLAYFTGVTFGGLQPLAIATALWVAMVLIVLAAGPRNKDYWAPAWVRGALVAGALILLVVGGKWLLRNYVLHRPRATVAELRKKYIANRTVYLADTVADSGSNIREKVFEDCTIIGPAIVTIDFGKVPCIIDNVRIIGNVLDRNATFYEMSNRKALVGAIGFDGVRITNCDLLLIGLLATPERLTEIKSHIDFSGFMD